MSADKNVIEGTEARQVGHTPTPCYRCGSAPEIGTVEGVGTFVVSCSRRATDGNKNCANWTPEYSNEAVAWAVWDAEQEVGPIRQDAVSIAYSRPREVVKAVNAHEGLVEALRRAARDFENIRRNLNNDDNETREDKCLASIAMIDAALEGAK